MKKIIFCLMCVIFNRQHAKQITIVGPITGAFNQGSLSVTYKLANKTTRLSSTIGAGKTYVFQVPDAVKKVLVKRTYSNITSQGKFCVPCYENVLDLESTGVKLHQTKYDLPFDDQLPPLRSGMVYGWTWR